MGSDPPWPRPAPEGEAPRRGEVARTVPIDRAAVVVALKDKLAAMRAPDARAMRRRKIEQIARACATRLTEEVRHLDHATLLYDERGLPR